MGWGAPTQHWLSKLGITCENECRDLYPKILLFGLFLTRLLPYRVIFNPVSNYTDRVTSRQFAIKTGAGAAGAGISYSGFGLEQRFNNNCTRNGEWSDK